MATRAKALGAIGSNSSGNAVSTGMNTGSVNQDQAQPVKGAPGNNQARPNGGRDGKENAFPGTVAAKDWDDLDAEDNGDPLMVSEYVVEIIEYMRRIEVPLTVH